MPTTNIPVLHGIFDCILQRIWMPDSLPKHACDMDGPGLSSDCLSVDCLLRHHVVPRVPEMVSHERTPRTGEADSHQVPR